MVISFRNISAKRPVFCYSKYMAILFSLITMQVTNGGIAIAIEAIAEADTA
jgi:hypothetical protein